MTKYRKMSVLHHISTYSHTCGSDAITFIGSTSSLEVTRTLCYDLGLLGFSIPKIGGGGCTKFRSQLVKNLFWPYWSFDKFYVFSVSKAISCCLMALVADLEWCRHHRPCFRSGKHHHRILALTSRLSGLVLNVPFWLSLTAQHRRYQCRSQWSAQLVLTVFHGVIY